MSVTSGFFNSLSGDRKYDAIQISSMFDGLITDGIYNGFLESFMVTASSSASMVVTVGEGRCWFNHTWTLNDAPLPLTLDVGDVVLNRIDTVVIDVDSTDTVRACTIKVVKGTPSSQAVRPTLENTETHHQYPLCDISVPAGATTITQSNITNRRGTSDCPFVATLMESVDVDDLLIQWESQWNDWMTDRANSMDSWTAEQKEAFTTWFQTVQDILDENTAGNLLNRINHRTGINATATYSAGVVAITAPDDAGEILTFVAPSDFLSSDTYTLNGEALTITDLNGEALDDSWKKNSPITITVSGGKAFFKAGGSGKNDTLPPLLGNMTVEVVEGEETDTYTIKMDKLVLDKTTEMVGGAQLEWGEEMPAKPGKGTGGIKIWTRDEVITTGKPFDGLYLGDVTASDAVTEDPALATQDISTMAETGTPVQLKDIPVSTAGNAVTLKIPESETSQREYLYLDNNYKNLDSCLALRKECLPDPTRPGSSNYGSSSMNSKISTWKESLPSSVKKYLVPVSITYQTDTPSSSVSQMTESAFLPMAKNMNVTDAGYGDTKYEYFDTNVRRTSKIQDTETNVLYYTRDINSVNTSTYYWYKGITASGSRDIVAYNGSAYLRPILSISPETWFLDNGDGTYTFAGDEPDNAPQVTHTVEVPHGQKVVFRQFTQNQKKQFQTMLVGAVYPPLVDDTPKYSEVLAENTWAQIAQAVADKDPILDVWQVGDTKDEVIAGETLTFAIMGKNMDDLADGSGKAGLTFGMTQLMAARRQMNSSNTNSGSFAGSAMYSWLSGTIYPNLPTELKDAIKAVNKKTSAGGGSSVIRTDAMYLWLFSEIEVFGTTTYSRAGEGTQYPYFATSSERIKRLSNGTGAASYWWERSPSRNDSYYFCNVIPSGSANSYGASHSSGVCFGFCI